MPRQTSQPDEIRQRERSHGVIHPHSHGPHRSQSASATPSMRAKIASLIIGMRMRFETKPGKSLTSTRRLAQPTRQVEHRAGGRIAGP